MEPRSVLIVHGSKYGQTEKIACRIGDRLRQGGWDVEVRPAKEVVRWPDLERWSAVIVGAPVLMQRHPKAVREFVIRHRAALKQKTTAFFSVSGSAAGKEPSQQADAQRMLADFLRGTAWQPTCTASFAGAYNYTRYNPLLKWVMRRIAKKVGASTDTTKDQEFTDWQAVERFAREFAALPSGPGA